MKTQTITVTEYAQKYGCTPRYVRQNLSEGIAMIGMVSFKKMGKTWIIEVLNSWVSDDPEWMDG